MNATRTVSGGGKLLRFVAVLCCVGVLSACGFHLRGAQPLPEVMERTHIRGGEGGPLYYEIESALINAGAAVVDSPDEASAVLTLHSQRIRRRVLSVDAAGRAAEYALTLRALFSLHGPEGRAIAERETVEVVRDYGFDPQSVLAKGDEEAALRRDMERFAAAQMMRRIQALTRQRGASEE
ncbi:MAG: LPS assembly lipoprotein LptE [Pseudomonadota bacterium]